MMEWISRSENQPLCIAAGFLTLFLLLLPRLTAKRINSIPLVKGGLPFFGQMFDMLKGSPWDTMAKWVYKYGTVYRIHLFGSDAVVIADPSLLKIALQLKLSAFNKDTAWTYKPFMVILGNGLVTSEGDSWREQRARMGSYLKIDILEQIPKLAVAAVHRLCKKLDKVKAEGATIEMAEEFRHLTLQVIAEAVFSIPAEESDQTFAHMYLPIVEEGNLRTWSPHRMYLPTPSWFKFHRDVARLNNYVTGLIERRWELRLQEAAAERAGKGPTSRTQDVLDKTLSSIPKKEWCTTAKYQVRDEMKTFILAGHETSASMLTWALYELSRNTDASKQQLQRLLDEAAPIYAPFRSKATTSKSESGGDGCAGKIISLPNKDEIAKLTYAECCLRESLRKYSVVPSVVRMVNQDVQMGPHLVHKGSTVMLCVQGVHHNPEYWPEPLEYRPERFQEPIAPYTFLPFIEGPRMCLGQFLSLLESKIVLSMLLSMYRFEVVNTEDAGEKHPYMVPIIPKTGHFMRVY